MKNKRIVRYILLALIAILAPTFAFAVTMSWFILPGGKTEVIDGEVGLRSYYYTGNGTEAHPYEIVKPSHFYNLTRLQNLGKYPTRRSWQIGHWFTAEDFPDIVGFQEGYYCLDSDNQPVKYLDMSDLAEGRVTRPIGGEGVPFYGEFNGNDIPVQNLRIEGYPEDIGTFGYVAYQGHVHNLILDNPTVVSLGYNPNSSADDNVLFRSDVENFDSGEVDALFNQGSYFAQMATLYLYNETGAQESCKKTNGYTFREHINAVANLEAANASQTTANDYTKYAKGWFNAEFVKEENDPFTYEWHSSTYDFTDGQGTLNHGLLSKEMRDINNDGVEEEVIGIDLAVLRHSAEFNSGGNMESQARIYLTATAKVNDVEFTRVIQSYTIQFFSSGSNWTPGAAGDYSMKIYCDYIRTGGLEAQKPSYFHRNNIGFLAGHVDGNMHDCYVLGGSFVLNNDDYTKIPTETDTGLVGEIGKNVANVFDPEFGLTEHGDTGVMNFTGIYNMIRTDFEEDDEAFAGRLRISSDATNLKDFLSYGVENGTSSGDHLTAYENFYRYKEYLRHDQAGHYVTYVDHNANIPNGDGAAYTIQENYPEHYNSVDFLWNKVIEDDDENSIDRGLGVFKIVTSKNDSAPTGPLVKAKVADAAAVTALVTTGYKAGDQVITNNGKIFTFDGAEWDAGVNVANGKKYVLESTGTCYKWSNSESLWNEVDYGDYWRDNIGDCRIINGKKRHTKVYFSTAECNWRVAGDNWGKYTGNIYPQRATTIPSYPYAPEEPEDPEEVPIPIDPASFDYPFSRDFNYEFELDLGDANPAGQNYMSNTDSPFLTSYLYSILIDKIGDPVTPKDQRFGFMFRNSLNKPVEYLSSYMPVKKITNSKSAYETLEGTRYYPSNCIVFHIDAEKGANVSVIGNGADIGIYHFDSTDPNNDVDEWYTMKSKNTGDPDTLRYFEFDAATGETATSITPIGTAEGNTDMKDNGKLFAHIFKLPKGDYVIGGSTKSNQGGDANIYFLAVQGQSDAELGITDVVAVGGEATNVDFLLSDDGLYDSSPLDLAYFAFKATFNNTAGTLTMGLQDDTYIKVNLGSSGTSAVGYCRKPAPRCFYINSEEYTKEIGEWPPS